MQKKPRIINKELKKNMQQKGRGQGALNTLEKGEEEQDADLPTLQ
jgi:hypothetical protein